MFPWQPDQGQDVTLFHWLNLLPYANEACASLQTLALVCICIISTFAGRKVGHVRERRGRKKEFGFEKKKKKKTIYQKIGAGRGSLAFLSLKIHHQIINHSHKRNVPMWLLAVQRMLSVLMRLIHCNHVIRDMKCIKSRTFHIVSVEYGGTLSLKKK